jgi:hypothetical protein
VARVLFDEEEFAVCMFVLLFVRFCLERVLFIDVFAFFLHVILFFFLCFFCFYYRTKGRFLAARDFFFYVFYCWAKGRFLAARDLFFFGECI